MANFLRALEGKASGSYFPIEMDDRVDNTAGVL
jgi:hypothetical protein